MSRPYRVPAALPLEEQRGTTLSSLVELMQRLLGEDGCPWDREQDAKSLRRYVLEEACEVIDAIDTGSPEALCDELGDLLLQVVFLGELARRDGQFGPDDIVRTICEKLVRRHPHVFGEVEVSGAADVVRNWEAIKREERGNRPLLARVPRALPALQRATRLCDRAARVGFDWPDREGPREKVNEELAELDAALVGGEPEQIEHELGDLLLAVVNLARHCRVDAELALRCASDRFTDRFGQVEESVRERHGGWPLGTDGKPSRGISLDELESYWQQAKRQRP